MHKPAVFDAKAELYDEEFSNSLVGLAQRKIIHDVLRNILNDRSGLEILELNCGTGEDISFLKNFGSVTATDVSSSMLKIAESKNPGTSFRVIDLNKPLPKENKYDFIFSNFGGFNCIDKDRLEQLNKELYDILEPGGRLILVFISKWSLIEFIYFSLRVNFKKAFRRLNGRSDFKETSIFYYSVSELKSIFNSFDLISSFAVGKYLTGEYMNKWAPRFHLSESQPAPVGGILGADHILLNFIRRS